MSKLSLAAASLVAAIPGGFLTYLMVMTFLSGAERMETTFQVLAGITLAMSALVTIMPVAILIYSKNPQPVDLDSDSAAGDSEATDDLGSANAGDELIDEEEMIATEADADEDFDDFGDDFEIGDDESEIEDSDDIQLEDDDIEMSDEDAEDIFEVSDDDDFDIDFDDEEE